MISSPEAEMAVIGAVMFAPDQCREALDRLRSEHFSEPVCQAAWDWITATVRAGALPIPAGLHDALSSYRAYDDLGGVGWIADMIDAASVWAIGAHVEMVLDRASRRDIEALAKVTGDAARDVTEGSAEALLSELERGAAEIARSSGKIADAQPLGLGAVDMLEAAWDGRFAGASVGLDCLDRITGGIQPDHVWIVGGRTSMGKSIMLPTLGRGLAEQGLGVLMFSLEMNRREVQARIIADIAYRRDAGYDAEAVKFGDLLKGRGDGAIRDRARAAARQMSALPFTVVDRGGLTLDDIMVQALRQMRAWEKAGVTPGAVLIDHIGLVRARRERDSKAAESADTVDRLKEAAKSIGAPIIAAAQISRACENRQDKRPTLADLNWSGSIEQIADLVGLLYRDSYYLERSPDEESQREAVFKANELEIIVPKNRSGPTCTLHAFVDVACSAIRDKDEPHLVGRRA